MDDLLFKDHPKGRTKVPPAVKATSVAEEPSLNSAAPTSSTTSSSTAFCSVRSSATASTKTATASKVRLPRPVKFVLDQGVKKNRSGTQFSGARRRFNKLPEVKKKPAAAKRR